MTVKACDKQEVICSSLTNHLLLGCILDGENVPDEIWLEILLRLPIKSLLVCQSVCKSWNSIACHLKEKIRTLPVCGLLLSSAKLYICLNTKQVIIMQIDSDSANHKLSASGACGNGWLRSLLLDFDAFYPVPGQECFCAVNGGLVLAVDSDVTYRVHNPATKEFYVLPKSPIVDYFGVKGVEERSCIIVSLRRSPIKRRQFLVMRFCRRLRVIELYFSRSDSWAYTEMKMGDGELFRAEWSFRNYVALVKPGSIVVYFLTNTNCGVAVKLNSRTNPMYVDYGFVLPEIVHGGFINAAIGECEGCLVLSYFIPGGLWI